MTRDLGVVEAIRALLPDGSAAVLHPVLGLVGGAGVIALPSLVAGDGTAGVGSVRG